MQTSKIIKEAAYRLFEEKPFESIHVQDILDAAGVSRGTFYKHFKDKYDLIYAYYEEAVTQFVFTADRLPDHLTDAQWRELMTSFFRVMKERRAYYLHAGADDARPDSLWNFMRRYSARTYRFIRLRRTGAQELSAREQVTIDAFIEAGLSVFKAYMAGDHPLALEEWMGILDDLVPLEFRTY